jgi:hypothetical protein
MAGNDVSRFAANPVASGQSTIRAHILFMNWLGTKNKINAA